MLHSNRTTLKHVPDVSSPEFDAHHKGFKNRRLF
ncbi:hypothetical protein M758_10G034500 [Ceratodon purpureus]|nr:hypothetical protein M758_10G034500 [Ceratodon purpureus]